MPRRTDPQRTPTELRDDPRGDPRDESARSAASEDEAVEVATPGARSATPSLAGLGVAGITRRRVAWVGLVIAAAWIVVGFAGQAAEASRAGDRLADEQALTAEAAAQTEALRRELDLVAEERWILQQARAFQLGTTRERTFSLDPAAPPLAPDAPGSAVRRVGAEPEGRTPLESWLAVLFGPGPD